MSPRQCRALSLFNGSHTISARLPPTRGQSGCTECAEGHIALSCLRSSKVLKLRKTLQILQLCSVCRRCVLGALGGSCSCTRNYVLITTLYCWYFFFSHFSQCFFDVKMGNTTGTPPATGTSTFLPSQGAALTFSLKLYSWSQP